MYHRPYREAKRLQAGTGAKHLECIFKKANLWYCRVHIGNGEKISLNFRTEEEAYACWVGCIRTKRILLEPHVRPEVP